MSYRKKGYNSCLGTGNCLIGQNSNINRIIQKGKKISIRSGKVFAFLKNIEKAEQNQFVVEILSSEGIESSQNRRGNS